MPDKIRSHQVDELSCQTKGRAHSVIRRATNDANRQRKAGLQVEVGQKRKPKISLEPESNQ